jgi:hypothetical protein
MREASWLRAAALRGSSQRSGAAISWSSSFRRTRLPSRSKMPLELGYAGGDVGGAVCKLAHLPSIPQ